MQRLLPDEFIAADGHSLTAAFAEYALPLLGDPLPEYASLDLKPTRSWTGSAQSRDTVTRRKLPNLCVSVSLW